MYEKYFKQLKEECLIRNRSSRTAEAYISNIKSFMSWTGNKTMQELSLQDARDFILFKRKKRRSCIHLQLLQFFPLLFIQTRSSHTLGSGTGSQNAD